MRGLILSLLISLPTFSAALENDQLPRNWLGHYILVSDGVSGSDLKDSQVCGYKLEVKHEAHDRLYNVGDYSLRVILEGLSGPTDQFWIRYANGGARDIVVVSHINSRSRSEFVAQDEKVVKRSTLKNGILRQNMKYLECMSKYVPFPCSILINERLTEIHMVHENTLFITQMDRLGDIRPSVCVYRKTM